MSVRFLAFLTFIVMWPVFLNVIFLALLYQTAVRLFVAVVSPKAKIMSGLSVILAAQANPNLNLVHHLICSGSISLDHLRSHFKNQVLEFKDELSLKPYNHLHYTWRSVLGVGFWEPESKFDLCQHIKHYHVDDLASLSPWSEEDLVNISGQLVIKSYMEGISPWELLLLQNFMTKEGKLASVIILRIHPILTDGCNPNDLIHRLFGIQPRGPQTRFPQLLQTKEYLKNSYTAFKNPYELFRFAIHANEELDAWTRPGSEGEYVTLCSEQTLWTEVKRIMDKHGVGCNAVINSIAAGLVLKLIKDFKRKLHNNVDKSATLQNSMHPPAVDVGSTLSKLLWVKAGKVFQFLLHKPRARVYLQSLFPLWLLRRVVKVKSTFAFTHFLTPLEELSAPGLGRLLDIIPCGGVGQIGSIAVVASTAGQLRVVLTADKRILIGAGAAFANYVNRGLLELLVLGEHFRERQACNCMNCQREGERGA